MKKKVLLAMLVVALMFLAACGGGDDETPAVVDPPADEEVAETPAPAEVEDDVDEDEDEDEEVSLYYEFINRPATDMGGTPLRINAWWQVFNFEAERDPDEPGFRSLYTIYREAEQRYNTTLEFTVAGWGENVELLATSVLAGEPFADMVRLENWQAIPYAISRGLLTPLEHLYPYFCVDTDMPPGIRGFSSFAGYHWGFIYGYQSGDGVFFNGDMIEREGLPCPFELFDQGQWTWEAFQDLAQRATRVAADGTTEQYGIATHPQTLGFFLTLSNGGRIVDDVNGRFVGNSPQTIQAMEFMQELILQDGVVSLFDDADTFLAGNALFMMSGPWFIGTAREELGANVGFIPFPVGPSGSGHHSISTGPNMFFIPRGANPQALTVYTESRREARLYTHPDPDAWAEAYSRCLLSFEIVASMRHSTLTDRYRGFAGLGDLIQWNEIATGELSPATHMEAISEAAQAIVDEVFELINN